MKYYVFGQFTRYIRPGSRLLTVGGDAVAAVDEQRRCLTVVAMNAGNSEKNIRVDLSAFGDCVAPGTGVKVIRTSGGIAGGEHWAELPALYTAGTGFSAALKPFSVTTFLVTLQPAGQRSSRADDT